MKKICRQCVERLRRVSPGLSYRIFLAFLHSPGREAGEKSGLEGAVILIENLYGCFCGGIGWQGEVKMDALTQFALDAHLAIRFFKGVGYDRNAQSWEPR